MRKETSKGVKGQSYRFIAAEDGLQRPSGEAVALAIIRRHPG